ncbi:AimR family lysis-lysogeny pheromone receptor [Bacillus sp. SIMBA_154]|uniref:AimR family lysis-lysogeny pheromone receptor n=1 Tax=Bacillus sp. SIMBA_154 TaxID=3080859 RepID=UPI00397B2B37
MDIKKVLKTKCEEYPSLAAKLASLAGYSQTSGFYKFLNEQDRPLKSFNSLLKIVRFVFPQNESELIQRFVLNTDPRKQLARDGLEYASSNNLNEFTEELIEKLQSSTNAESKEWANVYKLQKELLGNKIDEFETTEKLHSLKLKTKEMKLFSRIVLLHNRNLNTEFNRMEELNEQINKFDFSDLCNEYIAGSYKSRVYAINSDAFLAQLRIDEARRLANLATELNISNRFVVFGNLHSGNSYIFSDYDTAKKYFLKALEASNDNEIYTKQVYRSLSFLENYWGKENKYLPLEKEHYSDKHEHAFYHIKNNQNKKAIEILNSIDLKKLKPGQKAFNYFYQGLISKDKRDFFKSVKFFKESGDKFFMQLPLIELKKMNVENEILEIFAM